MRVFEMWFGVPSSGWTKLPSLGTSMLVSIVWFNRSLPAVAEDFSMFCFLALFTLTCMGILI